jgi:hypothetical protein
VADQDIERWFADQQSRKARGREVCARKRWFATEAEAGAAALWDRTRFGEHLTCYHCEECNGWHLTGGRGRSGL